MQERLKVLKMKRKSAEEDVSETKSSRMDISPPMIPPFQQFAYLPYPTFPLSPPGMYMPFASSQVCLPAKLPTEKAATTSSSMTTSIDPEVHQATINSLYEQSSRDVNSINTFWKKQMIEEMNNQPNSKVQEQPQNKESPYSINNILNLN